MVERRAEKHPDTKNATMWSRSSCLGGSGEWEGWWDTPDTKNATLRSRVHVWGMGNDPDTENATTGSRSSGLGGSGSGKGGGTPQTRRTRRCGRVFMSGVWEMTQTRKTRPQGRVLQVWVVVGVGRMVGHPRHEEHDTAVTCSCLGYGKRPRHKKRDHRVAFLGSGW